MSNLVLRLLSAAVLLPLVIATFHFGDWWLRGLALLAAAACFFEYGAVTARGDPLARVLLFLSGMTVTALGIIVDDPVLAILSVQVAFVVLSGLFVLRPGTDLALAFRTLASLVFGIIWIAPGLICICRLRDLGDADNVHALVTAAQLPAAGSCFIMAAMTTTWANDTCAYFAGRFLGKHKMAGLISPKKTWEGFVGGAIGAPLFLLAGRAIAPAVFAPLTTVDIIVLSMPVALLGPVGDLAESLWKRAYDVKDSGNLIPGHGGMLDRIDAVFFVTPWVLGYFVALKPLLH